MKSTDIIVDVTNSISIDEDVRIAATLHLPEGWQESGHHLVFALHGGGYSRLYWNPPFADDSYSFAR